MESESPWGCWGFGQMQCVACPSPEVPSLKKKIEAYLLLSTMFPSFRSLCTMFFWKTTGTWFAL